MVTKFSKRNWTIPLVGASALILLQASACSRDVRPVEPLESPNAAVSAPSDQAVEKVDLRGVAFQRDGSITSASDPILDSALEIVKSKPGATVYVDSYCDPTGGERLNEQLSKERAAAVADYLQKHGVPADHIVAHGFGATNFVASNATHSGREQNRRIELVLRPAAAG
jgi:OmpA-OmpF porin, OOP family